MLQTFRLRTLAAGYFPAELPPPFTTLPFARFADSAPGYLGDLWSPFSRKSYVSKLARHHSAQVGKNRRILSIPNPINQMRLVQALGENFTEVFRLANRSPISASRPLFDLHRPRAIWPREDFSTLPALRARGRAVARYLLTTDVQSFYPRIYTHAIPWAFHGKDAAKRERGPALLGNLFDKILREAQDGQTLGIPVGPDTSLVTAELLLGAVDLDVSCLANAFRWYDDYEIPGATKGDCEAILVELERALLAFELSINTPKTAIRELPLPLEDEWVAVLRGFDLRLAPGPQATALRDFFSRAFSLSREAGRSVLRYAVRKLHGAEIREENWEQAQLLMAQAAMHEPEVLPHMLGCLASYQSRGFDPSKPLLARVLREICLQYARRRIGSEVAWSIWGHLQFSLSVPDECVSVAAELEDDIVALLLLAAREASRIHNHRPLARLDSLVTATAFEGEHWLVAYEGVRKGWLSPSATDLSAFADNRHVAALLAKGVYFYEEADLKNASAFHLFGMPRWLHYRLPDEANALSTSGSPDGDG